jgi:hypothetical protein
MCNALLLLATASMSEASMAQNRLVQWKPLNRESPRVSLASGCDATNCEQKPLARHTVSTRAQECLEEGEELGRDSAEEAPECAVGMKG